jgi:hypothetical protein
MVERRISTPRRRMFKAATIELKSGGGISGFVKNLSESGAMIEVGTVFGIPDEFTLVIEAAHFARECKVVWRKPNRIGVHFV